MALVYVKQLDLNILTTHWIFKYFTDLLSEVIEQGLDVRLFIPDSRGPVKRFSGKY